MIDHPDFAPLTIKPRQRKTGEWTLVLDFVDEEHMERWRAFFILVMGNTQTPSPRMQRERKT